MQFRNVVPRILKFASGERVSRAYIANKQTRAELAVQTTQNWNVQSHQLVGPKLAQQVEALKTRVRTQNLQTYANKLTQVDRQTSRRESCVQLSHVRTVVAKVNKQKGNEMVKPKRESTEYFHLTRCK